MTKVSVIIDHSGSMSCMSKTDIAESLCRTFFLQENFEFDFYCWSSSIEKIEYETGTLIRDVGGNANIAVLIDFLKHRESDNVLLLTDGFIDGDKTELAQAIRTQEHLKLKLIGIGADWDAARAAKIFPPDFIAEGRSKYIFTALEAAAALDAFLDPTASVGGSR